MEVANTLFYYNMATIMTVKSFIVQAKEKNRIDHFLNRVIQGSSDKVKTIFITKFMYF
jgi:hypothetical protein